MEYSYADNPFTYGNQLSSDRHRFFGRDGEVEQILGRLRNEEFESSSLVGDRLIGKTWLFNSLTDPSVRAVHRLEPGHYSFVYVDLEMLDETLGPEQLWRQAPRLEVRNRKDKRVAEFRRVLQRR